MLLTKNNAHGEQEKCEPATAITGTLVLHHLLSMGWHHPPTATAARTNAFGYFELRTTNDVGTAHGARRTANDRRRRTTNRQMFTVAKCHKRLNVKRTLSYSKLNYRVCKVRPTLLRTL